MEENLLQKLGLSLLLLALVIILPASLIWCFMNFLVVDKVGLQPISFITAMGIRLVILIIIKTNYEMKDNVDAGITMSNDDYKKKIADLIKTTIFYYATMLILIVLNK